MKKIIVICVLLSVMFAFPAWGAKSRPMSDERFVKLSRTGPNRSIIAAINNGANVNARDKYGITPLMYAAADFGDTRQLVEFLIKAGADVNIKDNYGKKAADYARENEKLEGTDILKRLENLSR